VLELKSKVPKLDISLPAQAGSAPPPSSAISEDVASALINLGYKEGVVKKALAEMEIPADATMEEVLKKALKLLMK
jgi:Holliday junction DNA helicase RuvA